VNTRRRIVACALLGLAAASCRARGGAGGDTVDVRQSAIDFQTGEVVGTISWNGAPVSSSDAYQLFMFEPNAILQWLGDADYVLPAVPVGAHTVGLYTHSCTSFPEAKIGEKSYTVVAGTTTRADYDLTNSTGRVTGTILVSGVPLGGARVVFSTSDGSGCSHYVYTNAAGAFSRILSPGSYVAEVIGPAGSLGSLSFSIDVSRTTDLAAGDFTTGAVSGTISWNGAPVSEGDAYQLYMAEPGSIAQWIDTADYLLPAVVAGSHAIGLYGHSCTSSPDAKIGEKTVTVIPGTTARADFDLTNSAGRVTGTILINGVPLVGARVTVRPTGDTFCSNFVFTDVNGAFSRILSPGSYQADIVGPSGALGSRSFSIDVGQTTDLAAIDFETGEVSGTISWNGAPVSESEAYQLFMFEPSSVLQWLDTADYVLPAIAPGPHTLTLYAHQCTTNPDAKLGEKSLTVAAGMTTAADFDLTDTAGRVTGTILVNGIPLAGARVLFRWSAVRPCFNHVYTDASGAFSRLLVAGSYEAAVDGPAGPLGFFTFFAQTGKTTNVDTFTTPVGTNVRTELGGGVAAVGGLSLQFSSVNAAGNTTVVKSGFGPPPPTGYQILGFEGTPTYWDLTTTAAYSGAISICIHYNQTDVKGKEQLLELHHDDGTGFKKVRNMMLDTTADIVCGDTDSLSPFAIVEPVVGDNTPPIVSVPASMTLEATGPGGAIATFVAAATDAEDGSPEATCTPASGSMFAVGTTQVICTATDGGGLSASASFTVRVADTAGPAFAGVPDTIVAYATSRRGAIVRYSAPTASDAVSGSSAVRCSPASGTQFPLGKSTVTCTAADANGNPSTAPFTVWVQVQAPADGTFFLRPIRSDGGSVFRIGRAVPVKFQLTGASAGITDLVAKLVVTRTSTEVRGTTDCEGDEDGEDTDMVFTYRRSKGLYGYRWKTRGESPGTYRLRAELGDDVVHEVDVSLKATKAR
jgi:hypothetical protein